MNIDKVMALMPTIGHETQAKIRTALEQLVVSAREGAFCEAADAIGGLYSTKPQGLAERVEALAERVEALERASAKNTGEGEVEHAASVSRSVSAKDASRATTPNNAEEGASAMRHGSGARPDATSLSTACPLCHGMLSEDECKKQNTPSPQGSTASAERSVRVDVVHANDGTPLMAAAHVAQPLTGGEGVPAWVPSVEEIQQFIDDGREGDLRALIASRAPAQPSVEEMAERLRVARNAWAGYAPGVVISPSDCWLALDRAAIGGGK